MLVLSRKISEVVTIGSNITVTVLSYNRGVVRLGITAPKSVEVHRKEIYDKIIEMNKIAAKTEFDALKNILSSSEIMLTDDNTNKIHRSVFNFSNKK